MDGTEMHYIPQSTSYWLANSDEGYCRSAFSSNFFQGKRKRRSGAVLGESHLAHCGTSSVRAGNHMFFSNIFAPPGLPPLFVSCTCDIARTDGRCRPSVRKLEPTKLNSLPESDPNINSNFQGHFLPVRASAGQNQDVHIAFTNDRYVFQFTLDMHDAHGSDDVHPWPTQCSVKSERGKVIPIIAYGCPVSNALDFQIHDLDRPNSLAFSTLPFTIDDMLEREKMVVQCSIAPLKANPKDMLRFCVSPIDPMTETAELHHASEDELIAANKYTSRRRLNVDSYVRFFQENLPEPAGNRRRLASRVDATGRSAGGAAGSGKVLQAAKSQASANEPISMFSPGLSHIQDEQNAELKKSMEAETKSRLDAIRSAVESGEFGDIHEVLQKSEAEVSDSRKMEGIFPVTPNIIVPQIFNQYMFGPSAVSWGVDRLMRAVDGTIAHPGGYGFGGISPQARRAYTGMGVRGNQLQALVDVPSGEVEVGFAKKRYGVLVDRLTSSRATALEVRARASDFVTFVDFLDRAIGQRVGFRNFGLSIRTDLDDLINPSDAGFATELYFQYKKLGVAIGTDVLDTKYYVSVGLLGVNVAAMRDFNSYHNRFQVNWGRGWQLFLEGDFPDDVDNSVSNAVGIGKPSRMYVAVGAGVGPDGLPMATANLQMPNSALGVGFLEKAGRRLQQYSVTAGRYTYLWENTLVPDNLMLPLILG